MRRKRGLSKVWQQWIPIRSPLRLDIRLMDVKMARAFFNFSPLASRTPFFFLYRLSVRYHLLFGKRTSKYRTADAPHTRHSSSGIVSKVKLKEDRLFDHFGPSIPIRKNISGNLFKGNKQIVLEICIVPSVCSNEDDIYYLNINRETIPNSSSSKPTKTLSSPFD